MSKLLKWFNNFFNRQQKDLFERELKEINPFKQCDVYLNEGCSRVGSISCKPLTCRERVINRHILIHQKQSFQ